MCCLVCCALHLQWILHRIAAGNFIAFQIVLFYRKCGHYFFLLHLSVLSLYVLTMQMKKSK